MERLTGIVSRGFSGKRKPADANLPPGQYLTSDFPVLSATPTDEDLIARATWPASRSAACYICGPTAFVERAASLLTAAGYAPERIKTERFGPTGQTR